VPQWPWMDSLQILGLSLIVGVLAVFLWSRRDPDR
jgi:hypothetical protein